MVSDQIYFVLLNLLQSTYLLYVDVEIWRLHTPGICHSAIVMQPYTQKAGSYVHSLVKLNAHDFQRSVLNCSTKLLCSNFQA